MRTPWFAFVLPGLLILSVTACRKSNSNLSIDRPASSIIYSTSLADTLPKKTYEALHLGKVIGTRVIDLQGHDTRYFVYEADSAIVLQAISNTAFSIESPLADTLCQKTSKGILGQIYKTCSQEELEAGKSFWNSDFDQYDFYECIKSPMKHHILINKKTNKILHRIEYI